LLAALIALLCAVSRGGAAPDDAPPVGRASDTSAAKWTFTETLVAGGTLVGTLGLMPLDEPTRDWVQANRGAVSRGWAAGAKVFGDGYAMLPAVGLLWGIGAGTDAPRLARASRNGLQAWGITQLVVQSAKHGLRRARPSESISSQDWRGPGLGSRYLSFPSGHSSNAWALLPAFALEYADTWWVPALVYATATSTSLSRVHDGEHWVSDVFFAAGVGIVANRVVRRWSQAKVPGVSIVPLFVNDQSGVAIVSRF
jgi:membrane-associated phospholipid phosphatase